MHKDDFIDPLKKLADLPPAKKVVSLLGEYKSFAFKGNVVDLAVGIIIGTAFGKIVDSLVKQIIMPLIGVILPASGGYTEWKWVIDGKEIPYGVFLGDLLNFLIVSLAVFLFIIKFLGWIASPQKEETAAPEPLTKEQELLMEIRDLLKNTSGVSQNAPTKG